MGFYEISPLVNFNITESFQVRVNSLDYKRPEEQHGLLLYIAIVNFNITESFQVRVNSLDYKRLEEHHRIL
jgi:hypothetical protein